MRLASNKMLYIAIGSFIHFLIHFFSHLLLPLQKRLALVVVCDNNSKTWKFVTIRQSKRLEAFMYEIENTLIETNFGSSGVYVIIS